MQNTRSEAMTTGSSTRPPTAVTLRAGRRRWRFLLRLDRRNNVRWQLFGAGGAPASTQQQQSPNILFIIGDDVGLYQLSIYHRRPDGRQTPNIDRIGNEGTIFAHSCAGKVHRRPEAPSSPASSTPHRRDFLRNSGQPSSCRQVRPALASFLLDQGYDAGGFRQEPCRRPHRRAANRAWFPDTGLPVSPRCDARA